MWRFLLVIALLALVLGGESWFIRDLKENHSGDYEALFGDVGRHLSTLGRALRFSAMGIGSAVLCAALVLLSTANWRRPKVFISYHLGDSEEAELVKSTLQDRGCKAILIQQTEPAHDLLLQDVQRAIRECHTVVAFPGKHPSFMDAELLTASTLRKSIILLAEDSDTLPDTLYSGYPVFSRCKFRQRGYAELAQLILTEYNYWLTEFLTINFIESAKFALYKAVLGLIAISILCCGVFCLLLLVRVGERFRMVRVFRQTVISRPVTTEELSNVSPTLADLVLDIQLPLRHRTQAS